MDEGSAVRDQTPEPRSLKPDYWQHFGQNEKTLEYFQAVHQADAADPHVAYKYAEALLSVGRNEEGMRMLEKVIALDPGFISAIYRLASQYQRAKQPEKAMPLFVRFKNLNEAELTGGSFTVLKAYGTAGKYYMALGADNLPQPARETPAAARILFSPEVKSLPLKNRKSEIENRNSVVGGLPGLAAGDVDGDGDIDLLITAIGENGSTSLWLNNGKGEFSQHATIARHGISPCFGDVDNDGDLDLWLGCAGPDLYFENDGKGNFKKVEAETLGGGQVTTCCNRLVDLDSDGDLDFVAFRATAALFSPATCGQGLPPAQVRGLIDGSVYNNNSDGSFTDIAEKLGLKFEKTAVAAVVYDDFDNDRDLDLVIFRASGQLAPSIGRGTPAPGRGAWPG